MAWWWRVLIALPEVLSSIPMLGSSKLPGTPDPDLMPTDSLQEHYTKPTQTQTCTHN